MRFIYKTDNGKLSLLNDFEPDVWVKLVAPDMEEIVETAKQYGIDVNDKYKLHIIYNATASPSEESFSTINDSPEAITFSWEISTIPVEAGSGYLPTAILTIDKTKLTTKGKTKLATLEQVLYGTNGTEPRLPNPKDVIGFFNASA